MKQFVKKHYRKIFYIIIAILVLYIAFGVVLYLQISTVPSGYYIPDNRPSSFVIAEDIADTVLIDTNNYSMSSFEEVQFPSLDTDITLSAWYIPSKTDSPIAIIIVPGYRESKAGYRQLMIAGLLHEHYNVLILDLRNTGFSSITTGRTTMGNTEYRDVLGAKQWLSTKGFTQIGLIGISMGAATAALTFSHDQSIQATLLDAPFTSLRSIMQEELARLGFPRFLWFSGYIIGRIFFRTNLLEHDIQAMLTQNTNDRWLMFYHAIDDPRIDVKHSKKPYEALQQKNAPSVYAWFYNSDEHCTEMVRNPEEYKNRTLQFFNAAFNISE